MLIAQDQPQPMRSAVCTLFEGDYHYGVGALVNSLYKQGFRGVVWAGYQGSPPPWANPVQRHSSYQEFKVADGCSIRFVPVTTAAHFTNYKPAFMLDLWDNYCPNADELFYFDPDIVIKCRWSFYEEWASYGIALCQEITNSNMPDNHPIRMAWKRFAESKGCEIQRPTGQYFSGGFVGVSKAHASMLCLWKSFIDTLHELRVDTSKFFADVDRSHMILSPDQDTLNIAAMITPHPLSTIGPEGMDFIPGGFTMSHAVGSPKPWRKGMLREALRGKGPSAADKGYWQNTQEPIQLYTKQTLAWKQFALRIGSAIGRFVRRS